MIPVACNHCGAEVLARKSSWEQTSVQWNSQALSRCAHWQDFSTASPSADPVCLGCPDLHDSIVAAVAQGRWPVLDQSGLGSADQMG